MDVITFEGAFNRGLDFEHIGRMISKDKKVALGVISHRTLQVERPEEVAQLIRLALRSIEPDRLIPMGRLAEALACDASNVTGLIDRLESRGLVRRRPSADDRRVKSLELTPAGVRLRSTVLERITKPPDSLARLSADEQRELVKILKRLLD